MFDYMSYQDDYYSAIDYRTELYSSEFYTCKNCGKDLIDPYDHIDEENGYVCKSNHIVENTIEEKKVKVENHINNIEYDLDNLWIAVSESDCKFLDDNQQFECPF